MYVSDIIASLNKVNIPTILLLLEYQLVHICGWEIMPNSSYFSIAWQTKLSGRVCSPFWSRFLATLMCFLNFRIYIQGWVVQTDWSGALGCNLEIVREKLYHNAEAWVPLQPKTRYIQRATGTIFKQPKVSIFIDWWAHPPWSKCRISSRSQTLAPKPKGLLLTKDRNNNEIVFFEFLSRILLYLPDAKPCEPLDQVKGADPSQQRPGGSKS